MSASNQGQKRKSDVGQPDDATSLSHDEHPPAKKGRALLTSKQQTRPAPRPTKKITPISEQEKEIMATFDRRTAKKRPSEDVVALGDDPKTPAKKVKTGRAPLRRTGKLVLTMDIVTLTMEKLETMLQLVGSTVVTHRPTSFNLEATSEEETTPRPRVLDDEDDFYQTPVALTPAVTRKQAKRVDTETETESDDSVKVAEREEGKAYHALASTSDRVKSMNVRDDGS